MRLNTGLPLCEMTSISVSDGHHPWTKNFSHNALFSKQRSRRADMPK